jgi:small-conductance mechanosensitive channel
MKSSIAAALLILQGIINLIFSAIFMIVPGIVLEFAGPEAGGIVSSIFNVLFGAFVIVGVLQVVAGIAMFSATPWSWGLGVALSVFGLFAFPIGTILAIICLIVLASSRDEFERGAGKAGERGRETGNKEGLLILGTVVLLVGILWILATYIETAYSWASSFIVIGVVFIVLGKLLR